ncbi:MAG: ankyrin repeat domain-containing protein [Chlamydiales bacterium]|nr:ankyrin repeat domain-containing protein [Chlamydiales bacterium]
MSNIKPCQLTQTGFQRFTNDLALLGKNDHEILEIVTTPEGKKSLTTINQGNLLMRFIRYIKYLFGYLPSDQKMVSLALAIFQKHFNFIKGSETNALNILKKLQLFTKIDNELTINFQTFSVFVRRYKERVEELAQLNNPNRRQVRNYANTINREEWFSPNGKDTALIAKDGTTIYLHSTYFKNATFLDGVELEEGQGPEASGSDIKYRIECPLFSEDVFNSFVDYLTDQHLLRSMNEEKLLALYKFADFLGHSQLENACAQALSHNYHPENHIIPFLMSHNLRPNNPLLERTAQSIKYLWECLSENPYCLKINYNVFLEMVKMQITNTNVIDAFMKALPFIGNDENLPKIQQEQIANLINLLKTKLTAWPKVHPIDQHISKKIFIPLLQCMHDLFNTKYKSFINTFILAPPKYGINAPTILLCALFTNHSVQSVQSALLKEPNIAQNVQFLLEHGANPNSDSFLPAAILSQNGDLIKLLLKYGANINESRWSGLTPLMIAAQNQQYEIVQELLQRGANIDATDQKGLTVIGRLANQIRSPDYRYPSTDHTPEEILVMIQEYQARNQAIRSSEESLPCGNGIADELL